MASVLEDLDVQGDVGCNNATVRGRLNVAGQPIGPGVDVKEQDIPIANNPHTTLNFVGAGVLVTDAGGGVATVSIPGNGSGIDIESNGVGLANNPHTTLNFVGAGVAAVDVGGVATVTIPGGGGLALQVFTYLVTGLEPDRSELTIALPTARADANYIVIVQPQGCTAIAAFDVPTTDKTPTQFKAVATGELTVGDRLAFIVAPLT